MILTIQEFILETLEVKTDLDHLTIGQVIILMEKYAKYYHEQQLKKSKTRTFRFFGIANDNVKFVVNIQASDKESAIAFFELENPKLKWRTTTEITEI